MPKENGCMPFCRQCGKEVNEREAFCRHCGVKLSLPQGGPTRLLSSVNVTEEDFVAFIGKNAGKYLAKFKDFARGNEDSFSVTWHWPAFFVPFFWFMYRKLYGWMVLAFFLGLITFSGFVPYIGILANISFGMTAHYLYYRHAKEKLLGLKARPSSETERAANVARAGGVNNVVLITAIVLTVIALLGILAAIAIPGYTAYRQRAFDLKAKHEVQDACNRCAALFSAHSEKMEIAPDDLLNTGFSPSTDITMMLLDGRRETFGLSARHEKSKKVFFTDRNCRITEEYQKAP
jgi:hypothetical protein